MNRSEFDAKLHEIYSGTVKPLNNYINERATICFKCTSCGLKFFGKPTHIVGKGHQRHCCHKPYGNAYGERTGNVSTVKNTKKAKKDGKLEIDLVNKMIWEDYTYQQIAQELQVNPKIIKDHFISEGLITE
jgi:hypothetical protein